jgi:hypothetical protein
MAVPMRTRLPEREAIDGQASLKPLESSDLAAEREHGHAAHADRKYWRKPTRVIQTLQTLEMLGPAAPCKL